MHQIIKLQEVRNTISRDLHDDIGSTLSSIQIYSEVAKKTLVADGNQGDLISILNRISQSTSGVMENMQNIVWAINPLNDDLSQMLVYMQVFARQILEHSQIRVEFESSIREGEISFGMEKRRDLLMIFKESINNIARHAEATNVFLGFNTDGMFFVMRISDNGKGFESDRRFAGNGLRNITERVKGLQGILEIQSQKGTGTNLEIKIAF